ncbi:hypothetical protein Asbog_01429 [Asaia bogorensis NBRC 16594]|nr:hypothetical protein Asbog_01429 [Asaia bogorensis NBRC 16594]
MRSRTLGCVVSADIAATTPRDTPIRLEFIIYLLANLNSTLCQCLAYGLDLKRCVQLLRVEIIIRMSVRARQIGAVMPGRAATLHIDIARDDRLRDAALAVVLMTHRKRACLEHIAWRLALRISAASRDTCATPARDVLQALRRQTACAEVVALCFRRAADHSTGQMRVARHLCIQATLARIEPGLVLAGRTVFIRDRAVRDTRAATRLTNTRNGDGDTRPTRCRMAVVMSRILRAFDHQIARLHADMTASIGRSPPDLRRPPLRVMSLLAESDAAPLAAIVTPSKT